MKRSLLNSCLAVLAPVFMAGSLSAQCSAVTPTTTNVSVSCGGVATLTASGSAGYQWWDQSSGGNMVGTGSSYSTGPLTADTNLYVEGTATSPTTLMGLPTYNATFTGNVRGYWFTAPVDFTITGLDIPTNVSGTQNIAVVKLTAAPPLYSSTTNAFTTLFLTQNDPTVGTIPVNIPIAAGDIIGILGQAGSNNAYAPANYNTTIDGQPVTLARLGMQYPLNTTAPQELWTETTGSISLVEMYYTTSCTSPRVQVGVTVTPIPVGASAVNPALCAGDSTVLNATGATNYTWMPGNLTGASITVTPSATTTYTVTGDDGGMCSNTATVTVTVNPLPTISASASMATVCMGMPDTLTSTGGTTYSWSSGGTSAMEIVTPSSAATYTVTGTDMNGCSGSAMVSVAVNALPVVDLGPDVTQCGGSVTLDAQNAGSTYSWSDASASQMLSVSASGTYYVDVTDANGCMSSDTAMVTINSNPVVNLGPDVTQCGGSVTLDAQNAGSAYSWSDASTTQTISVSVSGTYYVDVTDTNGCTGSDTAMVTINQNPTVSGSATATSVCVDDASVALTGTPAGGTWSGTGVTGSTFSPAAAGTGTQTATYSYTDANGCSGSGTVTITVNACTGVAENVAANGVNVFPNPNNGTFTVAVNANVNELVIVITDLQGRVVYSSADAGVQAGFSKQVSLGAQASGLYFMQISADGRQVTDKIAVEK